MIASVFSVKDDPGIDFDLCAQGSSGPSRFPSRGPPKLDVRAGSLGFHTDVCLQDWSTKLVTVGLQGNLKNGALRRLGHRCFMPGCRWRVAAATGLRGQPVPRPTSAGSPTTRDAPERRGEPGSEKRRWPNSALEGSEDCIETNKTESESTRRE